MINERGESNGGTKKRQRNYENEENEASDRASSRYIFHTMHAQMSRTMTCMET